MFSDDLLQSGKQCQGLVFRAEVRQFPTSRGIGFSVRLVKAKRLSCPGCDCCDWQDEAIADVGTDLQVLGIETAEDGQFYELAIVNQSRDWETGYIDGWDLKLVKYEPSVSPTR